MPTATQEQLESHIGTWISKAAGIPFIRSEQTDGNGSAPPHPSAATTGSDTWIAVSLLDGPRLIGRAQKLATNASGEEAHKAQRLAVFSVKIQGPRAVFCMAQALESLDDGTAADSLKHKILGPFVFRHIEGPRHLQSQLETGYLKVSQADLTFVFQETWNRKPGIIEQIEGEATIEAPGDENTFTFKAEEAP